VELSYMGPCVKTVSVHTRHQGRVAEMKMGANIWRACRPDSGEEMKRLCGRPARPGPKWSVGRSGARWVIVTGQKNTSSPRSFVINQICPIPSVIFYRRH